MNLSVLVNIAGIANAVHVTLWQSITNPQCHDSSFSICQLIAIYQCLCLCLSLPFNVFHCISLSLIVFHCLSMSFIVFRWNKSLTHSLTRPPIELSWTTKNSAPTLTALDPAQAHRGAARPRLPWHLWTKAVISYFDFALDFLVFAIPYLVKNKKNDNSTIITTEYTKLDTMAARKTILVFLVRYLLRGSVVWILVNFIEEKKTVVARSITVIFHLNFLFNFFFHFRTKIQNPDFILVFFWQSGT